jgi:tRNA (cytidine(34)-2'-O)-methyltransferase
MLHVALLEPEIPPNTGNIIRLCVGADAALHLIGRLGFPVGERTVRRAAVDHFDAVRLFRHASLEVFEADARGARIFCFSAHAHTLHTQARYRDGDRLLFGSESKGLPPSVVERYGMEQSLLIPMPGGRVRSLNLANAVAIALYEALRQLHGW